MTQILIFWAKETNSFVKERRACAYERRSFA